MVRRLPGADRLHTQVEKGEVIVVCGPSGSGKSTLIKCVNGLEPFQQGDIFVNGTSVGDPKTNLPKLRARRHGVPALRAVPAHERHREPGARPGQGARPQQGRGRCDAA
jgi:ABC-type Fe3+/spermidine/putrescine transport system ATPase subunit